MSLPTTMGQPTLAPPESGVTVRMYNPGFGDCLLLAFAAEDGAHYVLIDFGVHHSYPGQEEQSRKIALDIAQATGKHLHTVVVTHEHTDHLRGFKHAQDILNEFEIDELWLAWTEDENNPTAKELKERYGLRARALVATIKQLQGFDDAFAQALQSVLEFEVPEALAATATPSAEISFLRDKAKKAPRDPGDYRRPGKAPLCLPGVPDVQVYVLGPPEDLASIRSLERKSELYPEEEPVDEETAFAAAVFAAGDGALPEEQWLFDRSRPFDRSFEIPADQVRTDPAYAQFYKEHYGFADFSTHGPAWRRIDTDWLATAEHLALKIDSKTNNTSLVLAFELTKTQPRKVLLFAADAQVANWLSWHTLSWPGEHKDDDPITAQDLLQRTVLYKVGHHGSHNATLKEKGLEMMDSPDLVAMLPVDQEWANEKQAWEHPDEHLYHRLIQRTKGRIMRTDEIPQGPQKPAKPAEATEAEWATFTDQLAWDDGPDQLWIQYTVPA